MKRRVPATLALAAVLVVSGSVTVGVLTRGGGGAVAAAHTPRVQTCAMGVPGTTYMVVVTGPHATAYCEKELTRVKTGYLVTGGTGSRVKVCSYVKHGLRLTVWAGSKHDFFAVEGCLLIKQRK
jgi:hypothetical protein